MSDLQISIEPFSASAYAPFGVPISRPEREADGREEFNAAWMLPTDIDGRPQWVYQQALRQPFRVTLMERHHHVAQMFVPITRDPFVMVVAPPTAAGKDNGPDLGGVRAFYLDGSFGLSIGRGVWHALDRLPVRDSALEFFFITEVETQDDMMAHAAANPERLVRSDLVDVGRNIVLGDPLSLLDPA
jgi:ureidoglycolate lyase